MAKGVGHMNLTYPRMDAPTLAEQMEQMKRYLVSLVDELNFRDAETHKTATRALSEAARAETLAAASADPGSVSGVVKALILRSADVVEQYTDLLEKRLSGRYLAESAFGSYREETALSLRASSERIDSVFASVRQLQQTLAGTDGSVREISARIRHGNLGDDAEGNPVYGIEVGEYAADGTFRKYARFTAEDLSFYDRSGSRVAWISDYQLHITSAEIAGNLRVGGYVLDTADGLAFRPLE